MWCLGQSLKPRAALRRVASRSSSSGSVSGIALVAAPSSATALMARNNPRIASVSFEAAVLTSSYSLPMSVASVLSSLASFGYYALVAQADLANRLGRRRVFSGECALRPLRSELEEHAGRASRMPWGSGQFWARPKLRVRLAGAGFLYRGQIQSRRCKHGEFRQSRGTAERDWMRGVSRD
jgi:hypothetical protein